LTTATHAQLTDLTPTRDVVLDLMRQLEDRSKTASGLEEMLTAENCDIHRPRKGEDAPEAMSRLTPRLVFVDADEANISVDPAWRGIRTHAEKQGISILVFAKRPTFADERRAFECGAADYIAAPFDPVVTSARIRVHLDHARARAALEHHNAALEERVTIRTSQLHDALKRVKAVSRETIFRLATAAEFRDEDTGAHLIRMSRYSAMIASAIGLPPNIVDAILYAAPLHDIGKIGIPDGVLLKPAGLGEEEWAIMRQHPEMGARILANSDSEVIQLGEVIAHTHHERWDGGGYPRGLRGEQIPIVGRIIAVADVFDALTSRRPYKEPFSIERAFSIVKEESGTHFDPRVVDAFFSVVDEVRAFHGRETTQQLEELLGLDTAAPIEAI
jgi:cyclic di-GMP phosphodiesterase